MGNSLNIDLTNKYVVLDKKTYQGDILRRVFFCEDGFGTKPSTIGNAIFGYFVADGEKCRIEGYEIERLATDSEINDAKGLNKGTYNNIG